MWSNMMVLQPGPRVKPYIINSQNKKTGFILKTRLNNKDFVEMIEVNVVRMAKRKINNKNDNYLREYINMNKSYMKRTIMIRRTVYICMIKESNRK